MCVCVCVCVRVFLISTDYLLKNCLLIFLYTGDEVCYLID